MTEEVKKRTIRDWLEELASKNESSEDDSLKMQILLRRNGAFPIAVVVLGIVYLDGIGTIEAPPTSIHEMAKIILASFKEKK